MESVMAANDSTKVKIVREKIKNEDVYDTNHVYLVFNEKWNCFKIGISVRIEERLEKHRMNGFHPIQVIKRADAKNVERTILKYLRSIGLQMGEDLFENQFDGWTECWHKDDLNVKTIQELIELANSKDEKEKVKDEVVKKHYTCIGLLRKYLSTGKKTKEIIYYDFNKYGYSDEEISDSIAKLSSEIVIDGRRFVRRVEIK